MLIVTDFRMLGDPSHSMYSCPVDFALSCAHMPFVVLPNEADFASRWAAEILWRVTLRLATTAE
jgi:hypothetical protein